MSSTSSNQLDASPGSPSAGASGGAVLAQLVELSDQLVPEMEGDRLQETIDESQMYAIPIAGGDGIHHDVQSIDHDAQRAAGQSVMNQAVETGRTDEREHGSEARIRGGRSAAARRETVLAQDQSVPVVDFLPPLRQSSDERQTHPIHGAGGDHVVNIDGTSASGQSAMDQTAEMESDECGSANAPRILGGRSDTETVLAQDQVVPVPVSDSEPLTERNPLQRAIDEMFTVPTYL